MNLCKLSVIIPVYNVEKYLEHCLESVLSQSFSNFEVLLIDDGSVDASGSICDKFSIQDARIKVFHKKNEGVSIARNVGLDNAHGEWVVFIDADDLLECNAFANLVLCAEKASVDVLLASTHALFANKKREKYKTFNDSSVTDFLPIKHYALWGYIFKRSVIESNTIRFVPGLAYSEDRVFLYTLSRFCRIMSTSSEVVYIYRMNEDSVCASKDCIRKFKQHVMAADCLRKLKRTGSCDAKLNRLLNREIKHVINLGMYMFVSLPFSRNDLESIKSIYTEYFSSKAFFLMSFISQYCTFKRRDLKNKILKWRHL